MIQVIERVARILEYLAENRNREVPLTEIADSLDINRATCANILKSMKELSLVEQSDYRKGYLLGDKIFSMAGADNGSNKLARRLSPLVDALCRDVNENVMLAVIKNDKRVLLHTAVGNHAIEAKTIPEMRAWKATTAKVILAQYSPERLANFLKVAGMPGKDWPEIRTRQELFNALAGMKGRKCVTVINHHFACMAIPVFFRGEVVASLGFYLPDMRLEGRSELLEEKLIEAANLAESMLE